MYRTVGLFSLLLLLPFLFGCHSDPGTDVVLRDPYSKEFSGGRQLAEIKDLRLREASGMVASRKNEGLLWVHNDSGNQPRVFLIDTLGEVKRAFYLKNALNFDWEDIAFGSGPTGDKQYIYVGDIGDNHAIRPNIQIYRFEEPALDQKDSVISSYEKFTLQYPDSARDAEAMMVDPLTRDIYIISKREEKVRVYQTPNPVSTSQTLILQFMGTLPFHLVTAADITANGGEILVKNYLAIFYWKRNPQESIFDALQKEHQLIQYTPEPQGEAIAWKIDNTGFYTISERVGNNKQFLYYHSRK